MTVKNALLSLAGGDAAAALSIAEVAAGAGEPLGAALAAHLRSGVDGVYNEPAAFEAFINNGGNIDLYERTIAALQLLHRQRSPRSVLDIGCGDGRVIAGALGDTTTEVTVIEPSAELLAETKSRFAPLGVDLRAIDTTVEDYLDTADAADRWDLAQATFALHNLSPGARGPILSELRNKCGTVAIVECDVPRFEDGSDEHASYAATTYARGIEEYAAFPEVVSGFLMPVLVGQFDPNRTRHTYEHPIDEWAAQLSAAGFQQIEVTPVADYWWAPASLVIAS